MRFLKYNDDWIKTCLFNVAIVVGGGTPDTSISSYWNGNIQWFTPTEIGQSKYVSSSKQTISKQGLLKSNAKILPKGTILLTSRATIGECSITQNECTTNQGFQNLIAKPNMFNEFLYYLVKTKKRQFIKYASGSTFLEISNNEIKKTKCSIPDTEEQKYIVSFLSKIDERIQTQSKIIEDLMLQINYIKYKLFKNYITEYSNSIKHKFDEMFIAYKKLNTSNLQQYTIGKNGIKIISNIPIYSTNSHIVFEPNSLILGLGIEEIGISINTTGCCSPIYKTYKINNSIVDTLFLSIFVNKYFFMLKNFVTQKSTRRNFEFDYKSLTNITFTLPKIEIQKKDALMIEKFYIRLKKEKDILSLYKKQKAYLLQNMFI